MCELREAELIITASGAVRSVDSCMRALVQCLNDHGICTYDSCCGHGTTFGHITIGVEDAERARQLGFRVCRDTGNHAPAYPFAVVDQHVNIILPPTIREEQRISA